MVKDNTDNMRRVMALWMKHQPSVSAYIASVVRDRHHVEDIAQEVASAISMQVDTFDADRPFLPWALGIAHNQVLKYLRTRKRDRLVFDDGLLDRLTEVHADQAEGAAARKAALHDCMKRLPDERKALLEDRYFKRVGVQQMAEHLGKTEGAVSMLLMRVRQTLANCIRKRIASSAGGEA
ncbi:MAG: sigma-70 family RNA polymerase sigma factor [Planctomycetota bacterium]